MYLQIIKQYDNKQKKLLFKLLFVGVLKVSDENNRVQSFRRIQIH